MGRWQPLVWLIVALVLACTCAASPQGPGFAPAPAAEDDNSADDAAPGPAPQMAPAPDEADVLLLETTVSMAPASDRLSNGSRVALSGQLSGLSQQHFNSQGGSNITLLLSSFQLNRTAATAFCAFPRLDSLVDLQTAAQGTDPFDSEVTRPQYLQLASGSARTPALWGVVGGPQCSDLKPSSDCSEGTFNVTATCGVPPGSSPIVPVLLLEWSSGDEGDDGSGAVPDLFVVPGPLQLSISPVTLEDVAPLLGSASGNTSITLKGQGFTEGMQCLFLNGTAEPLQRLPVNASIASDTMANCQTVMWPLLNEPSMLVVMQLRWPDGSVLPMGKFLFVPEPVVREVVPQRVSRYSSAPFSVRFNASYAFLAATNQTSAAQPVLRLRQPAASGIRVDLPAVFRQDEEGLTAFTPSGQVLANGSYLVYASLNGGRDWSGGPDNTAMVLEVEGPTVSMMAAHFVLTPDQQSVKLHARLSGRQAGAAPVTVNVTMDQRAASGVAAVQSNDLVLWSQQLYWDDNSPATQAISLNVPPGNLFRDRALVVSLEGAAHADIDPAARTTIMSAAPRQEYRVTFEAAINQVVYPEDNISVAVKVTPGRIPVPAAAAYELAPLTDAEQPFLAGLGGVVAGTLEWDPASGGQPSVPVPIEWSQVPMDAIHRVGLALNPAWNSAVVDHRYKPAVHVFGVSPDTCPPGTFLKDAQRTLSTPATVKAVNDSRLSDLYLIQPGGSVVELSTQFDPNTTLYGTMVSPGVSNAALCVDPAKVGAQVAVFDPANRPIPPLGAPPAAETYAHSVPDTGRRLAGELPVDECAAELLEFRLTFQVGQNNFEMFTTGSAGNTSGTHLTGSAATQMLNTTYADMLAAGRTEGNPTVRYSLAVVRAAIPAHAQLATLNATIISGGTVEALPVCGTQAVAAAAGLEGAEAPAPVGQADGPALPPGGTGSSTSAATAAEVPCRPDQLMELNVTSDTAYLSLHPALRYPTIQGIRVEVNGQVLSQGGNLNADRIADTTSRVQTRSNPDFLPAAVIVGLQPGVQLQVPIVIIAEDGVTSLRYYVGITRDMAAAPDVGPAPEGVPPGGEGGKGAAALEEPALSSAEGPLAYTLAAYTEDPALTSAQVGPAPEGIFGINALAAAAEGDSQGLSYGALASSQPIPDGWPVPPALKPECGACIGGWSSTQPNASYCTMCQPGTYAASTFSPDCASCPLGTYGSSWGSTHCRHCVTGTYGPKEGGQLCLMCPDNFTTLADGSSRCDAPVGAGTDLRSRYAVVVSFGVLLNGTELDDIARRAGVNASSAAILDTLVRSDTASAFNVSLSDVHVTGVKQLSGQVLYVKVSAALPVDVPAGASAEDVRTALNVKSISADEPIQMLVTDPDKFFGRTTKALNVNAEGDGRGAQRTLNSPRMGRRLALAWPAILGICLGGVLVLVLTAAVFARRRTRRAYQAVAGRLRAIRWSRPRTSSRTGGGGRWSLAGWGLAHREGSGSSVATSVSSAAVPGGIAARARPEARMLPRSHADSAAEAV